MGADPRFHGRVDNVMQKRTLGRANIQVSAIGLGCWQLGNDFGVVDDARARAALEVAFEQGINFFDTADVYGNGLSETRIGAWLKGLSEPPFVVTKVGRNSTLYPSGYTKENVRASIIGSATRLGVEALDLVQLHCVPREVLFSGEMLGWMEDFKQQVRDGFVVYPQDLISEPSQESIDPQVQVMI